QARRRRARVLRGRRLHHVRRRPRARLNADPRGCAMNGAHRRPNGKRAGSSSGSLRAYVFAALALLVSVMDACGSAYAVFAAVKSLQWRGAENLAILALMFVAIPTLVVQVAVFLPLAFFYGRSLKRGFSGATARGLLGFALLMPAVTL